MVDAETEGWIEIAQRGFENWKAKPHNARWFRKIDGTPIPNDLTICIGEAFAEPLRSLSLRVEAEKRAREAAETHSAALARALEELSAKVDAFWNDPERPSVHRMRSKSVHELSDAQRRAQSLLAPKEDTNA